VFMQSAKLTCQDTWTKLVPIENTEACITYRMTWLSGEDHFVNIRLAFFMRIKCLWFSRNACIFYILFYLFIYTALPPTQTSPPSFFEIKFYSKKSTFFYSNQCVPRRHKNKHWREWATFKEYWYALEYKAPFISTSTNFLQPSQHA